MQGNFNWCADAAGGSRPFSLHAWPEGGGGVSVQDRSPHVSFILKGSQISALQVTGWFKTETSIQEYRNGTTKLVLNVCMNYMVHVSSTV